MPVILILMEQCRKRCNVYFYDILRLMWSINILSVYKSIAFKDVEAVAFIDLIGIFVVKSLDCT